jgi:hypothetical protein
MGCCNRTLGRRAGEGPVPGRRIPLARRAREGHYRAESRMHETRFTRWRVGLVCPYHSLARRARVDARKPIPSLSPTTRKNELPLGSSYRL